MRTSGRTEYVFTFQHEYFEQLRYEIADIEEEGYT